MPKEEFPFFPLENDNNSRKKYFFLWQKNTPTPTFNFKELVEHFFPSVFLLAFAQQKQNPNLTLNWRTIFLNAISKITISLPQHLSKLLTAAIQSDFYNFELILKELPAHEFNAFFSPTLIMESWLKIMVRCEKTALNIFYQYLKAHYQHNFPINNTAGYWSLLDWAIVCQQTEEVAKLATAKNHHLANIEDHFLKALILTQKNAAAYSDISTLEVLIEKIDGFLSIRRPDSHSPLWEACTKENLTMISFLLSQNQDPNESSNTYPPIASRLARDENLIAAFNVLLQHNIDIHVKHALNNHLSITALAASTSSAHVVALLLEHHQSNAIHIPDEDLEHALILAVNNDSFATTEVLLNAGVNPNAPNFQKKLEQQQQSKKSILNSKPVVKATKIGNPILFKLLIKHGAKLSDDLLAMISTHSDTAKWYSSFYKITQLNPQQSVNNIAIQSLSEKDQQFRQKWLHNVVTTPVTTWEELLFTMENALKNIEQYSLSLSKEFISQFKQAMTYIEIKIQLDKNNAYDFGRSLNNNVGVSA